MGEKRKFILHCGWPKTGSTSLQRHVFPNLKGLRYLGKKPFTGNRVFPEFTHLVCFASDAYFERNVGKLHESLMRLEAEKFGDVGTEPLLFSDEAIFSSMLDPVDHGWRGISVTSPALIAARLQRLESLWDIDLDVLWVERDPADLLHSHFAQDYNVFEKIPAIDTLEKYIQLGLSQTDGVDLGFDSLRPNALYEELRKHLPESSLHRIVMSELFEPGYVHLDRWYPFGVDKVPAEVENARRADASAKIAHHRPLWIGRSSLGTVVKKAVNEIKTDYLPHKYLEVRITMSDQLRDRIRRGIQAWLATFICFEIWCFEASSTLIPLVV